MTTSNSAWFDELNVQLRLAGMDGRQIGAIREEIDDHLQATGEPAAVAFGTPAGYASQLAQAHDATPAQLAMTRSDLVAAAVQILGWLLVVTAVVALRTGVEVAIRPGQLAGVALLTAAMVWPVWPSVEAWLAHRVTVVLPIAAMIFAVAAMVTLHVWWTTPILVTVPAPPTLVVGVAVIVGCWARAWRHADPIRRPDSTTEQGDADAVA